MSFDENTLREAIDSGDIRVLLMVLFHLTGDHRWLESPYSPTRDIRLIADPAAGLPIAVQDSVRSAMFELLRNGVPQPVIQKPDRDLFLKMMMTCLGEPVGQEYVPMTLQEMGFEERTAARVVGDPDVGPMSVVIVGAGISGIAAAIRLEQARVPYVVLEKNTEVGGTWFNNRYPDAGVDTPNHFYSFSFAPNPDWTHYFSPREEILEYIQRCVKNFSIRNNIRFGTTVTGATWDEAQQRWSVQCSTAAGTGTVHGTFLISAVGQLNRPKLPSIAGLETFEGLSFHSAEWPDKLDLDDLRVGVVGTGASAMQFVPRVAESARELTVFQRSAQWIRPVELYRAAVPESVGLLFRHVPYYAAWYRFTLAWRYGDGLHRTLKRDPSWPYPDRSINKINDRIRQDLTNHLTEQLGGNTDLVSKTLPTYPPYATRMLVDNGWFATLLRPNVRLVTNSIVEVTTGGLLTADGAMHELDVLAFATGFQASSFLEELDIRGRDGRALADDWADENASAYLGITVPSFPNFFLLYGPNTNLAHGGSIIFHAECQVRYVLSLIQQMAAQGISSVEVRREVHDAYNAELDAAHAGLIWSHPGAHSWYRNKHGRVIANSPWRLVDYWNCTHVADIEDYIAK
jgi:4-hydroxyacetophenone monooxygenase